VAHAALVIAGPGDGEAQRGYVGQVDGDGCWGKSIFGDVGGRS